MSRPSSRLNFWSVPPSSTSASHGHRVVALQQRVEQLEHRDRLAAPRSVWRSRRARAAGRPWSCRTSAQQLGHRHVEPFAVAAHLQPRGIVVEDPQRLLLEGRGVGVDLLVGRASGAASSAPRDRRRGPCSRRRSAPRDGRRPGTRAACAARPRGRGGCRARSGRSRASRAAGGAPARRRRASPRERPRAGCRRRSRRASRPSRRRGARSRRRPRRWRLAWGPMLDSRPPAGPSVVAKRRWRTCHRFGTPEGAGGLSSRARR